MAVIREQIIALRVSTLVKDESAPQETILTDEIAETLEAVAGELLGTGRVVEVIRDL